MTHSDNYPKNAAPTFRGDFEHLKRLRGEKRVPARLIAHYQLERDLATRLRQATAAERPTLYGQLYSKLFTDITDHPQHTRSASTSSNRVSPQIKLVRPHLDDLMTFMEVGCGDAALSAAVSKFVTKSIGVDVTEALITSDLPANFQFLKTDGIRLNLPDASVDVAYSYQLVEHLHPDDALAQLKEILRTLKHGGKYLCITPSRLTGPHDISGYFDYTATGFHLKEYDYKELRSVFVRAGFRRFDAMFFARGRQLLVPYPLVRTLEICFALFPRGIRARMASLGVVGICFAMNCIGTR
jgi:SAM-dependent methyltransferase